MKKHVLGILVVLLWLSCFVFHHGRLSAEEVPKPQVSAEKSVSGLITRIAPHPPKKAPPASPDPETSFIRTDVKEYRLSLANLSDRYEIIIMPTTAIKVGGAAMLPDELKADQHFITATYNEAGGKTELLSVSLDKVKAPAAVKFWSLLIALLAAAVLMLLLNNVLRKTANVTGGLFIGCDNRYSNSKVQMVIWTFLVIFSYVALFCERYLASLMGSISYSSLIGIPENLGILMGISAASFVGAKAITASKVESGAVVKTVSAHGPSFADLITNDAKAIDLGDAQMFMWTLVAAAVYVSHFLRMWWYLDPTVAVSLPDVDSTLLVLTGVSQAAYAGKKLVTSDVKPSITSIDPAAGAKVNETITINGASFGNKAGELELGAEGITVVSWYDGVILAKIAPARAGAVIPQGKTVLAVKSASNQAATVSYTIL